MKLIDFLKFFPWNPEEKKPSTFPVLKLGSKNKYYLELLHKQLVLSGANLNKLAADSVDGIFGEETQNAVIRFQQTHIGPDKENLDVDGIVGQDTWWALFNNSGDEQRKFLQQTSSNIGSEQRLKVIQIAQLEHSKKVVEQPKGSNWGGEVSKYLKFCGSGPNPWCLAFVQWVVFTAIKFLPWKQREVGVRKFWLLCSKLNLAFDVKSYSPIPGDLFVVIHKNGTGHIGIITNVNSQTKATKFNAIEGNSGDRVALRERTPGKDNHVGYINFYGDANNRPNFNTNMSTQVSFDEINKTR